MSIYRDQIAAALQRAEAIERDIAIEKGAVQPDRQRIAELTRDLMSARQSIASMNKGKSLPRIAAPTLPPSQASAVLLWGILSLVVCPLFGPVAWIKGDREIAKMSQNFVDSSDRGLVVAGRICGIIATSFLIVGALITLLVLASM